MWLGIVVTTGAGVTSVGLGAIGTTSVETLRDRRRVRHGAILLAIGSLLAFFSVVSTAEVDAAFFQQLLVLEVTMLLVSGLVVARFAEDVSAVRVARQEMVLRRAARHVPAPRSYGPTAGAPRVSSTVWDDEEDTAVSTVPFSEAQRHAFERAAAEEPPPRRVPRYQPRR